MIANKKNKFEPDYAVPPGETLLEINESLNMSKKELALRLELTEQTINRIIKGIQPITYTTANKLELVTGISAKFWNNLETNYREQLAKLQEQEQLKINILWLNKIPVTELIKRGFVKQSDSKIEQLRNILQFYGVSSVKSWESVWERPKLAARRSLCFETKPEIASAWIRCGEIKASNIYCDKFDINTFKDALNEIRGLTILNPDVFLPQMTELCKKSGIALTLIPKMDKVPWNGASKWVSSEKGLIILNIRGKTEDKFWFSFFHEANHILHDSKKGLYIADGTSDPNEIRADKFAADFLIPSKYNPIIQNFTEKKEFIEFAQQLGISVGIVVGRFQHITKKWNKFKYLIKSFQWKDNNSA